MSTILRFPVTPHYTVRPHGDRWVVVHPLPGQAGGFAVDVDCATLKAAETECAWLQAERDRVRMAERQEALLLGQRDAA